MTGHGGWPMTVRARPRRQPVLRRHLLPRPSRGTGSRRSARCSQALVDAWADPRRRRAPGRRQPARAPQPAGGAGLRADRRRGARRRGRDPVAGVRRPPRRLRGRPEVPAVDGAGVPAAARGADRRRAAHAMLDATCEAMARGGMYDQLGGGFARYSVDRRWVVPHFEKMLYDNAQLLGVYARWGGPLGERVARETADFLLRELRTAEGGFASALDADSEGVEGKFYAWTPEQLVEVLGPDDGAWAAQVFEVTAAGHLRARRLHAPAAARTRRGRARSGSPTSARCCSPRARRGCGPRATTRWSPPGTAWRSPGCAPPGCCSTSRRTSTPRSPRASCSRRLHTVDGRLRRVSRDGAVGRHAAVLEDLGCVASGYLALLQATGDAVWLERAPGPARRRARPVPGRRRRLLRHRRRRRGAGRPAPRPLRQRQPVRAVRDGARAGRVRRADRLGPAPRRPPRRRSPRSPRWPSGRRGSPAGRWPPPRRCSTGPLEIAVVGPRRTRPGRAGAPRPPASPARWWSWPTARARTSRCWPVAPPSAAAPRRTSAGARSASAPSPTPSALP